MQTIETHVQSVEEERDNAIRERDNAIRERDIALNQVDNFKQERDIAMEHLRSVQREMRGTIELRYKIGEFFQKFAKDPAELHQGYDPDDYFRGEWSPLIVKELKKLYESQPRWTLVYGLHNSPFLVLLRKQDRPGNIPSGLKGDDGEWYNYQNIEGYF